MSGFFGGRGTAWLTGTDAVSSDEEGAIFASQSSESSSAKKLSDIGEKGKGIRYKKREIFLNCFLEVFSGEIKIHSGIEAHVCTYEL